MKALISYAAGLALVAILSGTLACSGGGGDDAEAGEAAQPVATLAAVAPTEAPVATATAEVEEASGGLEVTVVATNDFSFEPAEIELKAGETVTLVLDSSHSFDSHSFVIDEIEGANVSADAGIVASTEFTPLEPGTYTFYCKVAGHREEGMEGTLIVVE